MKVTIDSDSGFCFGVSNAIEVAERELDAGNQVFALGEIVHNPVQMKQLTDKGLKIIEHSDLPTMGGKKVLVRAHGEPPETFEIARKYNIEVIDATCPIVAKLQQRIHKTYTEKQVETQIVIFGKPGHAEVIGLQGSAGNKAVIVHSQDDVKNVDLHQPVVMYSQTTMDAGLYESIAEILKQKMLAVGNTDFVMHKSVCKQVSGRTGALKTFAAQHDIIVFVAGKNSSNGAYLFDICKSVNPNCLFVSSESEIDKAFFKSVESVGVTGATSTPGWLIARVAKHIEEL